MSRGQVDYSNPAAQLAGMLEQSGLAYDASGINVDSNPLRFGIAAAWAGAGAAGTRGRVRNLAAATDKIAGFTGFHHTYERLTELDPTTGGVLTNVDIALRRFGVISLLVDSGQTIAETDRLYVRCVAGSSPNNITGVARNNPVAGQTIDCTQLGFFVRGSEVTPYGTFAKFFVHGLPPTTNASGGGITITVGALSSHAIPVTVQLTDENGFNLLGAKEITAWLSDTAGGAPTGTAADGGIAVSGTGAYLVKTDTTGVMLRAVTGATGSVVLTPTMSTAHNYFLVVQAQGQLVSSTQLTYT